MAYSFNGSASLVLGSALLTAAPCTMLAWVNPRNNTADQWLMGLAQLSGASFEDLILQIQGTGAGDPVQACAFHSGGFANAVSSKGIYLNGWQSAAAVQISGSSRAAYWNGLNRGTNGTSAVPAGLNRTIIGAGYNTAGTITSFYTGNLAEVALYDVDLTPREILDYHEGKTPDRIRPGNLILYLPLRRETGIKDFSRNNSIFTNTSAVAVADHPPVQRPEKRKIFLVSVPAAGRTLSGALAEGGDTAAIGAGARVSGSLARTEASDAASGVASVGISGAASFAEFADGLAAPIRTAIAGAGNLHEANDLCAGHSGSLGQPIIDPKYLFVARPRSRRVSAATRLRSLRALPKSRNVIAAKRA
jgi:hypothetical protein